MLTQSNGALNKPLPGFEHVKRYHDSRKNMNVIKIMPGEYYVTNQEEIVTTVLGSCISACIRDPVAGVGGMNHFMIPSHGRELTAQDKQLVTRYGLYAMEHLINDIFKFGGRRQNIEIKLFGGGNIMSSGGNIGDQNIKFVTEFVQTEGYMVTSKDMGDVFPRKVKYCPLSGKVMMKKLTQVNKAEIENQELKFQEKLDSENQRGDIDLF